MQDEAVGALKAMLSERREAQRRNDLAVEIIEECVERLREGGIGFDAVHGDDWFVLRIEVEP